jgi:hypothetical protein
MVTHLKHKGIGCGTRWFSMREEKPQSSFSARERVSCASSMAVAVTGPSHIRAARRMSVLAGSDGSSAFRAVSAPQTGSVAALISPSCASTEAWSQ